VRGVAVAEGLTPADKIKVLLSGSANGVDAEGVFHPGRFSAEVRAKVRARHGVPADALVAGFVGRLVRDKGLAELARAWKALRNEFPALHLLVVGPFEPQDPVAAEVTELLTNDPRIHLVGMQWDMPPLYAAMDYVVLPTYREGLPVVPLEAAAMALPVVATRIPGCVEAVQDGVTGTLAPVRDASALAGAMRAYIQDPELRVRHGQAGRERVLRDFRPEAMSAALYEEYLTLLRVRGIAVAQPRTQEIACPMK
jgi:glycosyltransferase involved in cell wall biosynthesis